MSDWREHRGGACPVHPDTLCRFRFRNGHESRADQRASGFDWRHSNEPFSIAEYQVVEVPEDLRG